MKFCIEIVLKSWIFSFSFFFWNFYRNRVKTWIFFFSFGIFKVEIARKIIALIKIILFDEIMCYI